MNTDNRVNNLLFLLAAAPLGMGGCVITDGSDDDDGAATENATTQSGATDNATTDAATTDAATTDAATTDAATTDAATTDAATDDAATTDVNDTTEGAEDTTSGTEVPPECEDYGALYMECYGEGGDEAVAACVESSTYYGEYGGDCASAFGDLLACVNALTCKEFMSKDSCAKESAALGKACGGGK